MSKRVITKIGDIFSIAINENQKRYFQLIAFDLQQLNSDVIRCFNKIYSLEESPELEYIVEDKVLFYAHCSVSSGIKLNVWAKIGKSSTIGNLNEILFRDTNDYGKKASEEPIAISNNWYVWYLGDTEFTRVGKLMGENQKSFVGLVINPLGILELAKGNKYPINYPSF